MGNISFRFKKFNYFYLSLIVFVCSLPLSEFMVSASAGIMFLTALIEDSYSNKLIRIKQRKILLFIPAIFLIYLLSALISRNGDTVMYDLRKALFFIILPVAFIVGKEINSDQKQKLLLFFITSVIIASLIAIIKWKIIYNGQDIYIHNASLISHIRFSFQLILAIWTLILIGYKNIQLKQNRLNIIVIISIMELIMFLFLQKSLTGIISFIASLTFVLFALILSTKGLKRYFFLSLILMIFIVPVIYIAGIAYPFYHPKKSTDYELLQKTGQGNAYFHDFNNLMIENGNYVHSFVCEEELKEEWNKISSLKYDSLDQYGYQTSGTLIRYLTSRGLKKDAEGVKALTQKDVEKIKNGISNYMLNEKKWSLYPRIYVSVWEFYSYTKLHEVNNQSLSQRLEFSKAALSIIKDNFWIGVGTGNWKQAFYNAYKKMNSNLSENYYASSHNQYLNYLVKFGIIGFTLIMFFIIYPIIQTKRYRDPLFMTFLVFMFVANFADSNFESHMGSSFFIFFYCLFLITDGIDYLSRKKKSR